MPSVALVTYRGLPGLSESDQLLLAELERRGVAVSKVVWDDPDTIWSTFDVVVVRSVWDYHERFEEFIAWLDARLADGARVMNPPTLIRWNLDKRYLLDLERHGIEITPTVLVERGSAETLEEILDRAGWDDVVVKPNISASAARTFRTSRKAASRDAHRLELMLEDRAALIQPFVAEVLNGEWSFMFIGGEFSHAVLKTPAPGEFRVQEQYGGTSTPRRAPDALVEQARAVMRAVPAPWVYSRVDACAIGDRLQLMELELIEPTLFFEHDGHAAVRMADAILRIT
jgi:glutathione synthase/RimK-type ligase-like ATP-grasp enzyme